MGEGGRNITLSRREGGRERKVDESQEGLVGEKGETSDPNPSSIKPDITARGGHGRVKKGRSGGAERRRRR